MPSKITSIRINENVIVMLDVLPGQFGLKSRSELIEKSILYLCKSLRPDLYEKIKNGEFDVKQFKQLEDL